MLRRRLAAAARRPRSSRWSTPDRCSPCRRAWNRWTSTPTSPRYCVDLAAGHPAAPGGRGRRVAARFAGAPARRARAWPCSTAGTPSPGGRQGGRRPGPGAPAHADAGDLGHGHDRRRGRPGGAGRGPRPGDRAGSVADQDEQSDAAVAARWHGGDLGPHVSERRPDACTAVGVTVGAVALGLGLATGRADVAVLGVPR